MSFSEIADAIGENVENAGGSVIQPAASRSPCARRDACKPSRTSERLPLRLVREPPRCACATWPTWASAKPSARALPLPQRREEAVIGRRLMLSGETAALVAQSPVARSWRRSEKASQRAWKSFRTMTAPCWWTAPFATVETSLFEGAILVVVVPLIMLGNWRAALIVALAIPLSPCSR